MLGEQAEISFSEGKDIQIIDEPTNIIEKNGIPARQDAQARADMYAFLAAVYLRPPTLNLMRYLLAEDFLEELAALFGEEIVADLKKFAADAHPHNNFTAVNQEYMDLFTVPTGRYVTPFEDVYRGIISDGMLKRGPLLGERAIAARRIYRAAGADMDQNCTELPTHIGVELSFMSFLCEMQAAGTQNEEKQIRTDEVKGVAIDCVRYRELQVKFLNEHLNAWFPQLSRSIQSNAKSPFYQGMAKVTAAFLDYDTARI